MNKRWSKARLQKYNFCPQAFYWHYYISENHPLHNLIHEVKFSDNEHLDFFSVERNMLRTLFYDRHVNAPSMKNLLACESVKYHLSNDQNKLLNISVYSFLKSDFFSHTNPSTVHLTQTDNIVSVMCSDVEILGNVDFCWSTRSGSVNLLRFVHSPDKQSDLSFLLYYALKILHIDLNHLNIGLLFHRDNTWQIQWRAPDWQALENMQNAALSFDYSKCQKDFPPTPQLSHCEVCAFRHFCSAAA